MGVLLLVLLLLLVAFFAGAEVAFVTANRLRAEVRARREGLAGRLVRGFLHEPGTFLTTTLAGTTLALIALAILMDHELRDPLETFWGDVFGGRTAVGGWVSLSITLIAALSGLVVGVALPRVFFREPSDWALFALALPLKLARALLLPITKPAEWAAAALARLLTRQDEPLPSFYRRDLEARLRASTDDGTLDLDEDETEMLTNVFELRTLRVKDSMVPRTDVQAVEEGASLEEVRRRFVETGHSRLPVYRGTLDQTVGVVLAHDLFHAPASLSEIIRPVVAVPDAKPARDLLFQFLREGTSFAVVIDEYGGTAGIVTVEDLLEELFGDIRDEHDPAAAPMRRLDERTFLVSGRVRLDELEEELGLTLPEGDYDTVAGYLLDRLGAIPEERQQCDLDGLRFTIFKASANRIEAVRITRL
ncbi:MAG TPA: hemolysin family protein [Rubricoccaceae bacterium]|nr:hemolysin family protein [Rubricoccaceae bacterium]